MSEGNTRTKRVDLVCLGAAMIDLVGVEPASALDDVASFKRLLGGAPQNVATTAARLGIETALATRIGDDAFGRFVRAEIRKRHIRDDWIQVDPSRHTTLAFFASKDGKRSFQIVRGADPHFVLDDGVRQAIQQAAALHVTTFSLAVEPSRSAVVEGLELARRAGRIVSLDPNYRMASWPEPSSFMPLLRQLLPLTTVIKPSLKDAEAIWGPSLSPGDYIERFHNAGAKQVLLTLGRDGVLVSDGRSARRLPAIPIEAADTIGAGDAFTAGAIAALMDGRDLTTAARVGTVVASYNLRSPNYAGPLPRWPALIAQATTEPGPDAPDEGAVRLMRDRGYE